MPFGETTEPSFRVSFCSAALRIERVSIPDLTACLMYIAEIASLTITRLITLTKTFIISTDIIVVFCSVLPTVTETFRGSFYVKVIKIPEPSEFATKLNVSKITFNGAVDTTP